MLTRLLGKAVRDPRVGAAYTVNGEDEVVALTDVPQSSIGAPTPRMLAAERFLSVSFYIETVDPDWDGTSVRLVTEDSSDEHVATVRFERPIAQFFGPPNDEAFSGHPLAQRGLRPYGAFEVTSSSWIRTLERMNSVHEHHRSERFRNFRHFVLSFHDTTFECVAAGYAVNITRGSVREVMTANLGVM